MAVGNFDGVHRGHARIIRRLVSWRGTTAARRSRSPSILHRRPAAARSPARADDDRTQGRIARPPGRRRDRGSSHHAASSSQLSARLLRTRPCRRSWGQRAVVEGRTSSSAANGAGERRALLQDFCRQAGIELDVVEPLVLHGEIVSSSASATIFSQGRVAEAAAILTNRIASAAA